MVSDPSLNPTFVPATFDGEVFRPAVPVALPPNTEVVLMVESTGSRASDPPATSSFLDAAAGMNLEGPVDWASNLKEYLYGDRRGAEG